MTDQSSGSWNEANAALAIKTLSWVVHGLSVYLILGHLHYHFSIYYFVMDRTFYNIVYFMISLLVIYI